MDIPAVFVGVLAPTIEFLNIKIRLFVLIHAMSISHSKLAALLICCIPNLLYTNSLVCHNLSQAVVGTIKEGFSTSS